MEINQGTLERVARALCADAGVDPDADTVMTMPDPNGGVRELGECAEWETMVDTARAAITALYAARAEAGFVEVPGWQPISDNTPREGELIHIWTLNAPPSVPYIFASWAKDPHPPFEEDGGYWRNAETGYPYKPSEVLYWRPLVDDPSAMLAKAK